MEINQTLNKWANVFNWLMILMAFSLGISTSASGVLHGLFGAYCVAHLIRFNLWKKLLETKPQIWLLILLCILHLSLALNWQEMPRPTRGLSKLRYLWIGWLSVPVIQHLLQQKLIKLKSILLTLIGSYFFATIIGTITRLTGFEVFRMRYGNEHGRMPGITGIFQYCIETPWVIFITVAVLREKILFSFKQQKILWFISAIMAIAVFTSGTRMAILGFAAGIPFMFMYSNKKLFITTILVGSTLLAGLLYFSLNSKYAGVRNQGASNQERMKIQMRSLESIKQRPILGYGPYNVVRYPDQFDILDTHNTYLQILFNGGILAGIAFFGFMLTWAHSVHRHSQQLVKNIVTPSFVSFSATALVHSMFVTGTTTALIFMLIYAYSQDGGSLRFSNNNKL
jgi:O-antigen ligase